MAVEAACIAWSTAHGREEHDENVIVPGFSEQEVQEKVGKLSTSYIDRANCWTPQLAAKAGGNRMKRARRSRFISVLVENEEAGGGGSGGQAWGGKNLYNSSLTSPQKQYQQQQQHIYRQQQLQQLPNQPQQRFGSNGFMPSSPGQQMRKFGVTDRTSPGAAATPDRMTDTASSSSNADTNSTSPLVNHRFNWATPNKKPQQAGDGSSNNGKVSGTKSSTQTSVFAVLKSKSEKLLRLRKNLNNNTSSSENLSPPATPAPKKPSIVDENAPPNANNWVGRTGQLQIQQQQQQQQTAATQFRRRKASNDLLSPPLSPSGVVTEGDAIKINKGRRGSAEALLKDLLLECETFMRE